VRIAPDERKAEAGANATASVTNGLPDVGENGLRRKDRVVGGL